MKINKLQKRLSVLEAQEIVSQELGEPARWIQVALELTAPECNFMAQDKNKSHDLVLEAGDIAYSYNDKIEAFSKPEFDKRLERMSQALDEMKWQELHPSLKPLDERLEKLFLNPPDWMLKGPVLGGLNGKQYGGIHTLQEWVDEDFERWDIIHAAAKKRTPKETADISLDYTKEEWDEMISLRKKLKELWPKLNQSK